jgi:mxaD protein
MNKIRLSAFAGTCAIAVAVATTGTAYAADSSPLLHAEGSVELKESPDRVWAVVGDFLGIHRWHPGIKGTTLLEGENKQPLAVRQLDLGEGQWLISELLEWDGPRRALRYRILKSPLPFVNYVATYSVSATPNGGSVFTWKADFRRRTTGLKVETDDGAVVGLVKNVIDGGIGNLPKALDQ